MFSSICFSLNIWIISLNWFNKFNSDSLSLMKILFRYQTGRINPLVLSWCWKLKSANCLLISFALNISLNRKLEILSIVSNGINKKLLAFIFSNFTFLILDFIILNFIDSHSKVSISSDLESKSWIWVFLNDSSKFNFDSLLNSPSIFVHFSKETAFMISIVHMICLILSIFGLILLINSASLLAILSLLE